MRLLRPLLFAALLASCHPSATVQSTMPIANMQTYSTVALNVRSTAFASQGQAMMLEQQVTQKLQQKCSFVSIQRQGSGPPADVVLDLNVTNTGRGSGGIISNSSTAFIDTLLVLSEGQSGELLGSVRIHGTSSGMIVNNADPANEAAEVIAKTIAEMFAKSGCSGARVAKQEPPPVDNGQGSGAGSGSDGTGSPPDDAKRGQAEALNQEGTDKLRSADVSGALTAFQQANALVADARYVYNICLAYEAGQQWPNAEQSCKQARTMTTDARLLGKIDKRLDLIAHKQ
ncbi:MAG TPA: hypothetical protein VMZ53_31210 [Kofleriaceae bacterium]|nr:hypothetical protein [Kofleriaceae bacterium]